MTDDPRRPTRLQIFTSTLLALALVALLTFYGVAFIDCAPATDDFDAPG